MEEKSDYLLSCDNLRECCNKKPVFHQFTNLGLWSIECAENGHIHNTGLCKSKQVAIDKWNQCDLADIKPKEG